jgi:hypothetical protein
VLNLNVPPSDFWEMIPEHWWVLYEDYCIANGIKKAPGRDVNRLKSLFDMPEANPSRTINNENNS